MKKQARVSQLHVGPIRHPTLPDDFIARVKAFKAILEDVDTAPIEKTIDDFKRDEHPEAELVIWERIANTFELFLAHNPTTDPAIRRDIFAVLLGASTGQEEWPNIRLLTDEQIRHLVVNYRGL
jgi:hypothetical protein